jgi:hypothetical protein
MANRSTILPADNFSLVTEPNLQVPRAYYETKPMVSASRGTFEGLYVYLRSGDSPRNYMPKGSTSKELGGE